MHALEAIAAEQREMFNLERPLPPSPIDWESESPSDGLHDIAERQAQAEACVAEAENELGSAQAELEGATDARAELDVLAQGGKLVTAQAIRDAAQRLGDAQAHLDMLGHALVFRKQAVLDIRRERVRCARAFAYNDLDRASVNWQRARLESDMAKSAELRARGPVHDARHAFDHCVNIEDAERFLRDTGRL